MSDTATKPEQIREIVETTLDVMGFPYENVSLYEQDGQAVVMIQTQNAKPLIGVQGATLNALHAVIRQMVCQQFGPNPLFSLDVNNYREQQREALARKARTIAERARSFQSAIEMEPMTSFERFVVHNTLSEVKDIETYSEGSGKTRRVVVRYARRV